jgi:Flp pilus assembly protein TadB
MTSVDVFSACAFVAVLLFGLMLMTMQDLGKKRPKGRIKARMETAFNISEQAVKTHDKDVFFTLDTPTNGVLRWLDPKLDRLRTVAGKKGIRFVIAAAVLGEIVAVLMTQLMTLPAIAGPALIVLLPVFAVFRMYQFLVERFRKKFLDGFPDVIDLIVRAVRAGVPVTQVMTSAAEECPEPLKSEFQSMGDSLKVGRELEEALAVAMERIQIADFSFFCVCLLLQRETGGQLGETLDNLSGIVRSRREVRQKTKALTGEARITTKILAAVPVCIMGGMYMLNKETMMDFFHAPAGHKILTYSVLSVVGGVMFINKMSKLDTSR